VTIGLGAPLHDACATPRLTRRRFAPRSLATVQASAPGTRREVVFPTGNGALQSLSQSAAPVGWVNGPSPSEIGDSEDSQQLFVARGTGSMCDYSLHRVASLSAKVCDMLVSTGFSRSGTRGFAAIGEANVAVCLLPGTDRY